MRTTLGVSLGLFLSMASAGCSANRAACEADCEGRVDRCSLTNVDCPALCGTYIGLGDPGGCSDERLVYQGCMVDSACTTDCATELGVLNDCVADNSPGVCLRRCRDRDAAGCGDPMCAAFCVGVEYLGQGTSCRAEVDRWYACLATAPACDLLACLSELSDANNCRTSYCAANPSDPACG
jgi:hypothetical protein